MTTIEAMQLVETWRARAVSLGVSEQGSSDSGLCAKYRAHAGVLDKCADELERVAGETPEGRSDEIRVRAATLREAEKMADQHAGWATDPVRKSCLEWFATKLAKRAKEAEACRVVGAPADVLPIARQTAVYLLHRLKQSDHRDHACERCGGTSPANGFVCIKHRLEDFVTSQEERADAAPSCRVAGECTSWQEFDDWLGDIVAVLDQHRLPGVTHVDMLRWKIRTLKAQPSPASPDPIAAAVDAQLGPLGEGDAR
jgi:hypothetical protein